MEGNFERQEAPENPQKSLWKFALNTIKIEIVLYDLRQSLYWQSMIEVGIMLSAFIALLSSHSLLFFMHLVHIIRPYIAMKIIISLPRTHVILDRLPQDPSTAPNEAVDEIMGQLKKSSIFYRNYLILSGISAVFDLLALLYNLSNAGGTADVNAYFVNVAWLFLAFDLFILLWAKTLAFSFPKELWNSSREIANNTMKDTSSLLNGVMEQMVKGLK